MSKIIGQKKLIEKVRALKSFPSFSILEGPEGQGKKVVAEWIASELGYNFITIGVKVDDIREMIESVTNLGSPTIYFIPDADNMSIGAKNSLLKITEEPPRNLWIMMSVSSTANTLGTIKSRGQVFKLDNYSILELSEYITKTYPDMPKDDITDVLDIASNPGQINELVSIGICDFLQYVDKVYANILKVSTGNSFKISQKLKFKKDGEGYSVELFLKVFQKILVDNMKKEYLDGNMSADKASTQLGILECTSKALKSMSYRGINKEAAFHMWVLDVRGYR